MGRLWAQAALAAIFYRAYKRAHGEWGAWHGLFVLWLLATLGTAAVAASFFWDYLWAAPALGLRLFGVVGCLCVGAYAGVSAVSWAALGSRVTEGWWARLARYAGQLWLLGLACRWHPLERAEYPRWLRERRAPRAVRLRAGVAALYTLAAAPFVWLLGGWGDALSVEGWWHCLFWRGWAAADYWHAAGLGLLVVAGLRHHFMATWLLHVQRELDTGLIYRTWLRPVAAAHLVGEDVAHPGVRHTLVNSGAWYAVAPAAVYELPANWGGFHYYAADWDYGVGAPRFRARCDRRRRARALAAHCYDKYRRPYEYSAENSLGHIWWLGAVWGWRRRGGGRAGCAGAPCAGAWGGLSGAGLANRGGAAAVLRAAAA